MVYKYTPKQEAAYKATGERPKTSQLKRYTPGKKHVEPGIVTADGRHITEAQQRAEIAHDIQRNYIDKELTPPGELLRMAGLRIVKPVPLTHREETRQKMLARYPEPLTHREETRLRMLEQGSLKAQEMAAFAIKQKTRTPITAPIPQTKVEKKKAWEEKPLPKWVTDFMGDPAKLSKRERKIVLPFYGKSSADALKQKAAMTSYLNYVSTDIKKNPGKIVLFAALPPGLKLATRGIKAAGVTALITKIPKGELIAKRSVQLVGAGIGAVYTKDVYDRVTEPVLTGYKDGETTVTDKILKNGDTEITTTTEEIPQYRKPTGPEQIERLSGIFATELAPLGISNRIINRGIKTGYTKPVKPKPKFKIKTKIIKAGKVVKAKVTKTVRIKLQKIKVESKKIVKSNRTKRITSLYIQISATQNQIALAKTPAKKAELIKNLKTLENKITAEVAKKSKRRSLRLKKLLRDERAEVSILTYKPYSQILDYTPQPKRQAAPKPKPKRKVAVAERTKTASHRRIEELMDYETAKKLGLIKKPITKTKVKAIPITKPKTKTKTKTKTRTKTAVKTKVKTATAVAVKTKVLTKVKTKPLVKTMVATKPATKVKTAVKTKVAVKVKPKIKIIPVIVPFKLPKKPVKDKKKKKGKKGVKSSYVKNPVPSLAAFLK